MKKMTHLTSTNCVFDLLYLNIERDFRENSVFSNASAVVACRRSARRGAAVEAIVIFVDGSTKSVVHARTLRLYSRTPFNSQFRLTRKRYKNNFSFYNTMSNMH